MDVLSEVLRVVKLDGALFYNGEFSAPWSFLSPASSAIAPFLGPGARHVIIYHLLTEGRAYARVGDATPVSLAAGDVVIFPHGDPHLMGNGPPVTPVDNGRELERLMRQGLKVVRMGGGGELTRFVCGYMACEPHFGQVLLRGLPPIVKVNIRSEASGSWLESSIKFSVAESAETRPGMEAVLAKLSEALFIETLRRYILSLAPEETGWLAGTRDPEVGRALALLHREPARPWTISDLATAAGSSRSVLAERFQHYLGEPPIAYLTRWRLRLGAQKLTGTTASVAEVAADVGYQSEAAFNRAFKREFGVPPARFRERARAGRSVSA